MSTVAYPSWFESLLGTSPHPWQQTLGNEPVCRDRLIRIPTGFGKTAGVVLAWLYNRVVRADESWPTRLAFTLPMRVLVEQTASTVAKWLDDARLRDVVGVEVLMGGEDSEAWVRSPEKPTVLVGTQDMLLSRALNRGYGAGRARWPMDFGLLSQDALWVLDEVQLMDVGLMTSTQLAMFRREDAERRHPLRPTFTWWMSATLQPRWLESVDSRARIPELASSMLTIPASERNGGLWEVHKVLSCRRDVTAPAEIGKLAAEHHKKNTVTLIVVNRVGTAVDVYDELRASFSVGKGTARKLRDDAPDLRLVHSRFRGFEKQRWAKEFLRKDAPVPPQGRIIVATQVVEAGVDISAVTLVSELAPWPSLVQRFGRCARYAGDEGQVFVVGSPIDDEKKSAPYRPEELSAAADGLAELVARAANASPRALEHFEEALWRENRTLLQRLYPYRPDAVLRRHVVDELFDTSPDLTGVDLDVSQYIRVGDERDVALFWRSVPPTRGTGDNRWPREIDGRTIQRPHRAELCTAPLSEVKKWLVRGSPAWVVDYQSKEKTWRRRAGYELIPGQQVLLAEQAGGYSIERGFDPASRAAVSGVVPEAAKEEPAWYRANAFDGDDGLSAADWKTIAFHGNEVSTVVRELASTLRFPQELNHLLGLAGRWHDVGKAHEVFQNAIMSNARDAGGALAQRQDLAKAPEDAWRSYERRGFRHELASTLAIFELLRRCAPDHPALLGRHGELVRLLSDCSALEPCRAVDEPPLTADELALGEELASLSAEDFDLVAWLVCTHHGKVRCGWSSTPRDQEAGQGDVHGIGIEDRLPATEVMDATGTRRRTGELTLHVEDLASLGVGPRYGASWRERVDRQLRRFGPFQLAFLEAVFRAADWRASSLRTQEGLE